MKIITINLPEQYLEAIQVLNDLKIYPSRSEAIREALRRFLEKELVFFNELERNFFKMLIKNGDGIN